MESTMFLQQKNTWLQRNKHKGTDILNMQRILPTNPGPFNQLPLKEQVALILIKKLAVGVSSNQHHSTTHFQANIHYISHRLLYNERPQIN